MPPRMQRDYCHPGLAFHLTRIGPLGVVVWNGTPATNAIFEDHCRVMARWVELEGPFEVVLNVAGDFAPNMSQRRIVASYGEAMGLENIRRIAILTDSALARGALLVMTWLTRTKSIQTLGFRPSEVSSALAWLREVSSIDVEAALAARARAELAFRESLAISG